MKRLLIILLVGLLLLTPVCAEQVTMKVDSKHVIGMGTGATPLDYDNFNNVVYVISERQMNGGPDKYIIQEYPVTLQDYCKVKMGDFVTLEIPDSKTKPFKIVNIEKGVI